MFEALFFAFWFFGPAGLANVFAFLSSKIPYIKKLNYPVDFKLKFRGKRVLGSHKTIRGFVVGIALAIVGVYFQVFLYTSVPFMREIKTIDYAAINPILFGFLAGFGALSGDAIKSFFKRQMNLSPGKSWVPFDQIDYILGGILFTYFYVPLHWTEYLLLFFVWFMIHPLISFWGYLLKLKKQPI